MPGLTVDTSPTTSTQSSSHQAQSQPQLQHLQQPQPYNSLVTDISQETVDSQTVLSSSTSPVEAPPYSPITPTLSAARLAGSSTSQPHHARGSTGLNRNQGGGSGGPPEQQRYHYTHSQDPQVGIPAPPPIPVKLEENADAVALKSAISILQMQKRNAERDVLVLQRVKERAVLEPKEFVEALGRGDVKSARGVGIFDEQDEDEDDEEDMHWEKGETDSVPRSISTQTPRQKTSEKWERLPVAQNVVRCPPVNWNQYAVVGDSLDKLHQDQLLRPTEGVPQRYGSDGQYVFGGGEGQRRTSDLGGAVTAPYMPGRDRIDKPGPRKSAKKARTE